MKFLCEFSSAIETLVVIITEEKPPHCFYWCYGDPLLATSCHATEQICLVGVELPTSVCTCIIWMTLKLLLNIGLYCLGVYLASLLLTHQVPDGIRHPKSCVSGLNPGSLGWL